MPINGRDLQTVQTFPELVAYLRNELDWPIEGSDFEDLTFDYTPEELGIDSANAAKISEIKRLRPLSTGQPWGIFFVGFEPKRLPVVALRRILGRVVLKKRASANRADQAAWAADDLLFISNFGEGEHRQISFAHFSESESRIGLPILKVLGWDDRDTRLHMDRVTEVLHANLAWPSDETDTALWRESWGAAFTLRHREVVTTSIILAQRLAELARVIRDRILSLLEIETPDGPLTLLLKDFQRSLVHDLDCAGFADTYAQTIAYGLLSARMTDPGSRTVDHFAKHLRTSPFLQELLQTFLRVGESETPAKDTPSIDFDELGVSEVVALLDDANMEAVARDFGDRNSDEDPVIHFYELFLKEYDAKARMQRGVFYTPRPVVSYIVRSIDESLVTEFGLLDGLADTTTWSELATRNTDFDVPFGVDGDEPFVQILDPATGTGTFLVEVIDVIHGRLRDRWLSEGKTEAEMRTAWNTYVPEGLLSRLHGYELLMAPYSIAHLKLSLKLYETGYEFGANAPARVFLTNALDPATDFSGRLDFAIPALAREAENVNRVKANKRFTVILGNPPYSILSANLSAAQRELVSRYRYVDGERIRERGALQFEKNIQDDYVKFFALAENLLLASHHGVLGFVSNGNYLDASTLRGLRGSLAKTFAGRFLLDLHGDGTGAGLPESAGQDENVFDILQGVAIGLYMRGSLVRSVTKRADLGGSRQHKFGVLGATTVTSPSLHFIEITPCPPLYEFAERDEEREELWSSWRPLTDIFPQYSAGIITARDDLVIDHDDERLRHRILQFRSSTKTDASLLQQFGVSAKKGWDVSKARTQLRGLRSIQKHILPLSYRPFDERWIFYDGSLVWGRAFPTMRNMLASDNTMLAVCKQLKNRTDDWNHVFVSSELSESGFVSNKSKEITTFFPALLIDATEATLISSVTPNVERMMLEYMKVHLGGSRVQSKTLAKDALAYVYAIMHSPTYRLTFRDQLARGFPRIPLAADPFLTRTLTEAGLELIAIHLLTKAAADGQRISFVGSKETPVGRVTWSSETVWIDAPPARAGESQTGTIGFSGVSEEVWNFRVGSYQVCHKWLKDRKDWILSVDQRKQYVKIVGTIGRTLDLMREIDVAIEQHGGWPKAFADATTVDS